MNVSKIVNGFGKFLCQHRGNPFVEKIVAQASAFLGNLNNVNFITEQNGELRIIKVLAKHRPQCIFDVGAHVGDWSYLVNRLIPDATIHAFEIVPSTYQKLVNSIGLNDKVILNNLGLSDKAGEILIRIGGEPSTATNCQIVGMQSHENYYRQEIECRVGKAKDYIVNNGIEKIDFIKIDVEGMDLKVIRGLEDKIESVRAIQFEYGVFNISSHDLLADFCNYLNNRNFIVGKIFPRFVQFFDYHFHHENFHGSNYIAVKKNDLELIEDLKSY